MRHRVSGEQKIAAGPARARGGKEYTDEEYQKVEANHSALPLLRPAVEVEGGHRRGSRITLCAGAFGGAAMSAAVLLDRLQGVRATGRDRWLARCPAHGDKSPSLSIRELEDGRVLLHDFAGCDTESILAAVGLDIAALFPPRDPATHYTPPTRTRTQAADVLVALDHEAHVVAIIGADVLEHRTLDAPTWTRLAQAVQRIGDARGDIAPLKVKA